MLPRPAACARTPGRGAVGDVGPGTVGAYARISSSWRSRCCGPRASPPAARRDNFHPQADAQIGDTIHGESHAWCEAWTGDWWPFDPTNAVAVGERRVLVARGRYYRDIPPLKGIASGAPSTTPAVSVELTRHA